MHITWLIIFFPLVFFLIIPFPFFLFFCPMILSHLRNIRWEWKGLVRSSLVKGTSCCWNPIVCAGCCGSGNVTTEEWLTASVSCLVQILFQHGKDEWWPSAPHPWRPLWSFPLLSFLWSCKEPGYCLWQWQIRQRVLIKVPVIRHLYDSVPWGSRHREDCSCCND